MVIILKRGSNQETLTLLSKKLSEKKRKNNLKRWRGTLHLAKDPLSIQKELRDEWK